MTTIDELLKAAERHARATLIGGKAEMTPITHLVRREGQDVVIATPWRNADEKELTRRVLAGLVKDDQVVRYMMLNEGWMRVAQPGEFTPEQWASIQSGDELPRIDPICQHPKRIEIVVAIAIEKGGKTIRVWETKRDKQGNCVELAEIDTDADQWRGPTLDLLNA